MSEVSRKRGRPYSGGAGEPLTVRMDAALLALLDAARGSASRQDYIRSVIAESIKPVEFVEFKSVRK